ncbi:hypothetical protein HDU85_006070 [Gaertneriomyces sp. JEL0708]|nr:hypothetical protein HDU85_006070 [Gaertneriomyces sp. JEL0708]
MRNSRRREAAKSHQLANLKDYNAFLSFLHDNEAQTRQAIKKALQRISAWKIDKRAQEWAKEQLDLWNAGELDNPTNALDQYKPRVNKILALQKKAQSDPKNPGRFDPLFWAVVKLESKDFTGLPAAYHAKVEATINEWLTDLAVSETAHDMLLKLSIHGDFERLGDVAEDRGAIGLLKKLKVGLPAQGQTSMCEDVRYVSRCLVTTKLSYGALRMYRSQRADIGLSPPDNLCQPPFEKCPSHG